MSHDDAHTIPATPPPVSPGATSSRAWWPAAWPSRRRPICSARAPLVSGQGRAGGVERLLTLTVNGQTRRVDVAPQETLATTLRYKLGLTGTKLGCDRAECGACTVLVDDVPRYGCSVLTHSVRTKRIQTIEGLAAADGTLHPVQQGVVEEQGFQCAFCMSGFIMATVGFLKKHPEPDARGAGPRRVGQPVPVSGLRQDPHGAASRRRALAGGDPWLTRNSSDRTTSRRICSPRSRARRSTPKTSAPRACSSPSCC